MIDLLTDTISVGVEQREEIDIDLHDYLVKRSILEIPASSVDHEGNYRCLFEHFVKSKKVNVWSCVFAGGGRGGYSKLQVICQLKLRNC